MKLNKAMLHQLINKILRSGKKSRTSFIINILGLSLGLSSILFILFSINKELSTNKFHENLERIYCIFTTEDNSTDKTGWNETVPTLPNAVREEIPEVEYAAMLENGENRLLFRVGDFKNYEDVQFAEPGIFDIFSFPVVSGNIPREIQDDKILALNRTMANKYFKDEDPVGRTIMVENRHLFTVVAVFEDIPSNSTIHFDCWAPASFLETLYNNDQYIDTWYNLSFHGYVLLNKGVDPETVNQKLAGRIKRANPESKAEAKLYPFSKLYLDIFGRRDNVRTMGLIGFVILSLICINFINLQTADSFRRIKDFGIRKVNGATKFSICRMLIDESVIITFIALVLAIIIYFLLGPYLNKIFNPDSFQTSFSLLPFYLILIAAFFISVLAGIFSATVINSVSSLLSLKSEIVEKNSTIRLRRYLTTFQFVLAIVLIICTLFVRRQIKYIQNKDLGLDKEQVLYVNLEGRLQEDYKILKEEIDKIPSVLSSSVSAKTPTGIYWNSDGWDWDGKPPHIDPSITFNDTDEDFLETFSLKMVEGDYFKTRKNGVIINQTLADIISPEGQAMNKIMRLPMFNMEFEVIGIIEDFHFKPLRDRISPLMIGHELHLEPIKYLFIKISSQQISNTLSQIKTAVESLNPEYPYSYRFLDDDYASLYINEEMFRKQMMFFAGLAIFISCIGLWGMLLFTLQHRVKEIGIRKVNGARISEVMVMLNKDFVKWIAVAFVAATPVALFAMHKWLEYFAYKTSLSWWIFGISGILALGIALLTVSWQSWRAATRNPVEALRYE
jgi:putative ABC transport system permease protein